MIDKMSCRSRMITKTGAPAPTACWVRAVQEWEQGRRVPDRAARVLLTVIDRDPEAVVRALAE